MSDLNTWYNHSRPPRACERVGCIRRPHLASDHSPFHALEPSALKELRIRLFLETQALGTDPLPSGWQWSRVTEAANLGTSLFPTTFEEESQS